MRVLVALAIVLATAGAAWAANEQRCVDLASNCVCSEPLNTNSLPAAGSNWLNPADTTSSDKQCSMIGASNPGWFLEGPTNPQYTATNSATILNALPSGHAVNFVTRLPDGHTSTYQTAHIDGCPSNFEPRCAIRWYQFLSSNFGFQTNNQGNPSTECVNTKFVQYHGPSNLQAGWDAGSYSTYNFLNWSPPIDCCVTGPVGPGSQIVAPSTFRGKWFRFEVVIRKGSGPGTIIEWYFKNVTDGTAEIKGLDTGAVPSQINPSTFVARTPPARLRSAGMDLFRNGLCSGFTAFSHFMVAGWTTDAGQRISAATEIEGGGTAPLNAPTNPRACVGVGCVPASASPFAVLILAAAAWRWRRRR